MQLKKAQAAERIHNVVACVGGGRTSLEARPLPMPAAGEMLLRLRAVGFCGTDLFKLKTGTAPVGGVLGHELVGSVSALGLGVEKFALGDRVVVPHHVPCGECVLCRRGAETMCATFKENLLEPGGFADHILVRARAVEFAARKVPDHLSDESAVFMEPAACVLRGIDRSGLQVEGSAVVLGAGSMGLLHLLVLRAAFPKIPVVMVDSDAARLRLARKLGASDTAEPGKAALAAANAVSGGIGADAVFDTVGGERTLAAGIALTRPGGTVVLFAHAPAHEESAVDLNAIFKSERRIVATYSGALNEQRRVFDMLVSGALDPSPLVTHKMPLDDFTSGVELVVARQALKVLFTPSRGAGT
ncbi:MAG: zinc-dependent alcohol dehydrogenase [Propylenella sp.]